MHALLETSFVRRCFRTVVVLAFLVAVSVPAAGALASARDPDGFSGKTVEEMLRGDYSPVDVAPEIAITEVPSGSTVEEMLRGDYSPIDVSSGDAITQVSSASTVAEMLRGDYSPIA